MSYMGRSLNPIARLLLPAAVLLLAGGAGLFLLTGLVADSGQARALQQALQQLQVTLTAVAVDVGQESVDDGLLQRQKARKTAQRRR